MKINISIDATPEEVRRLMGLPELHNVHEDLMEKMSEQVKKNEIEPEKILEMLGPSMKAGQQIMESFLQGVGSASMKQEEQESKKTSNWR